VAEGRSCASYLTRTVSRGVDSGLCVCRWQWMWKWLNSWLHLLPTIVLTKKQKWYSPHFWPSLLISSTFIPCC